MNVVPKRRSGGDPGLLRQVLTKNLVTVAAEENFSEHGGSSHFKSPSTIPGAQVELAHKRRYSLQEHSSCNGNTLESCYEGTVTYRHARKEFKSPEAKKPSVTTAFPFNVSVCPPTPENVQLQNNINNNNHLQQSCTGDVIPPSTNGDVMSPFINDRTCWNPPPLPSLDEDLNSQLSKTSSVIPPTTSDSVPDDSVAALRHLRQRQLALSGQFCFSPAMTKLVPNTGVSNPPPRAVRRSDIVFGDVIGKGGFGKVHAGQMQGRPVAIKVVQKRRGSGLHREILQAERLAFSLNLRHQNIVNILGVNMCDGLRGDALIIMELVSPQTLQSVLDDVNRVISQSQRFKFALEITSALAYLHSNDVAHLDVKPRNVLMTCDDTCKLADFGSLTRTRRDVPREETDFTQLLGTLPYRAPELMKGCFPSNKADVYSLGITLWQLVTRETPHSGANPHWLIYQVTKVNKRPDPHDPGSDTTEVQYRDLYMACWDSVPDLRPHAEDVVDSLNNLIPSVWDEGWGEVGGRSD